VGTGYTSGPPIYQGDGVAISGDGNTAVVGGNGDNNFAGATWIFTRSGGFWSQQGSKLVPTGSNGGSINFGNSVGVSADGNTVIGGAADDSTFAGGAWIFTRTNGVWTQRAGKLSGSGADNFAAQGYAVGISADGSTAAVGGPGALVNGSPNSIGGVWVFTAPSWTQQGQKIQGNDSNGNARQGYSLALSADGNTLIEGGPDDNGNQGAAWIFTRASSGIWTQQGSKLTAANTPGFYFGTSVGISGDGNTAVVGSDSGGVGAAWVFARTNGVWSQQAKLVGTGAVGSSDQGFSVAISGNGSTIMVGGEDDASNTGAVWVFTRSGSTWTQQGSKLVGTGAAGQAKQGWSVALSNDASTAIVGGSDDNALIGAAWIFAAPAPSGTPTSTSLTPPVSSGSTQMLTAKFNAPGGYQSLDVVNVLINTYLDGRQACYLAYKQSTNYLYIVADNGDASQLSGAPMNGSGTVGNSQCSVNLNGSSAAGTGTQFTLQLNMTFLSSFGGNKVIYTAARDASGNNSGWSTMGVTGVPPLPSTFPNPTGMSPSSGNALTQTVTFNYQDQTSAGNLQTVWALINTAIDGRAACYVAYYRPGNALYLYPDNGDGTQATNITLAGNNTISNSQCTVSAQGSQVQSNGNTLSVTLPITFKTPFAGFKGVWLAAQTLAGAVSPWQALGAESVPAQ